MLSSLFGSPTVDAIFSDRGRLQGMLDFEAALAAAEARAGVIPAAAAPAISAKCRAELFDPTALAEATARAGVPAIPLVKQLTALVAVDAPDAARFVHWGATSQDVMDTGLVLQLREALVPIDNDLARLAEALAALAAAHKLTLLPGRTWLQHALPVTFGLKAAGWLDTMERHRLRLTGLRPRLFALQFGGAAGTLAALGDRGLAVAAALAEELTLTLPDIPWHTERDRLAELAMTCGMMAGSLGKIGRDLSLLMQTEVAEVFEPGGHGRGGSSTMPHKRNPVTSAVVLAAATRAPGLVATLLASMVQEHERGLGGWQAEWVALPELVVLTAGALSHMADTLAKLEVHVERMQANLEGTQGLMMAEAVTLALGSALGRLAAHERVEVACRRAVAEGRHLRQVLAEDAVVTARLDSGDLDRLFDPHNYLGVSAALVERVLAARRK
ncbi:MAG TPA: 3-carboxy-cis,cis-muconate cycloisomerase [Gemmatimonadales bacterium]|nr:3-carboxy-cis,cis-muconate cycloisomerase [Gemmatimonadales bacterium]